MHVPQYKNRNDKTCLNCNTRLVGKFCSNCGQDANTHRINSHFLWHDIQHGLTHVDKGMLFTIKELFTRPGNSIREFLEGKRIKHFKPISLVIILAGAYGFLSHYYEINILSGNIQISGSGAEYAHAKKTVDHIIDWVIEHYALVTLIQLPAFAFGTYIGFKKAGYNFVEHLVINSFLTAQRLLLRLITFPIFYYYNNTTALRMASNVIDFMGYTLMAWSLFQLFNNLRNGQRIWRILLSLAISFSMLFVALLGITFYIVRSLK